MSETVVLLSGGLDSVTALYNAKTLSSVSCIGFDYGQRHSVELLHARRICERLSIQFRKIELPKVFGGTALTTCVHVSGEAPVSRFVVPCRNIVFLSAASAYAASIGAECVMIGCNKDDALNFPDCRKEFIRSFNESLKIGGVNVEVVAPFLGLTKKQVVMVAKKLRVPLSETWSCYAPSDGKPCGHCDACNKRKEALK